MNVDQTESEMEKNAMEWCAVEYTQVPVYLSIHVGIMQQNRINWNRIDWNNRIQ